MRFLGTLALVACGLGAPAQATDTAAPGGISLELNTAKTDGAACTLTFLVENTLPAPLASLVYEAVLFDGDGLVDRLTLFDFGELPAGRPRVRQFAVPGVACEGLGMILINGADSCVGDGIAPDTCDKGLMLRSRTAIEVTG